MPQRGMDVGLGPPMGFAEEGADFLARLRGRSDSGDEGGSAGFGRLSLGRADEVVGRSTRTDPPRMPIGEFGGGIVETGELFVRFILVGVADRTVFPQLMVRWIREGG